MAKKSSIKTKVQKRNRIINIVVFVLFLIVCDLAVFGSLTGVIQEAETMIILTQYTDEEIAEKYKNNEYYTNSINNNSREISKLEEELNDSNITHTDYEEKSLYLQRYKEQKQFLAVTQVMTNKACKDSLKICVILDVVLISIFAFIITRK